MPRSAHRFETVDDAARAEHVLRRQTEALFHAARLGHAGMQLDEVDALAAEPFEPSFDGANRRRFDIAHAVGFEANLGRDHRVDAEIFENAPQVLLGLAQAVGERGVEERDPGIQRAPDDFYLLVIGRFDHEHGVVAAAETDLGNFHAGAADRSIAHDYLQNNFHNLANSPTTCFVSLRSARQASGLPILQLFYRITASADKYAFHAVGAGALQIFRRVADDDALRRRNRSPGGHLPALLWRSPASPAGARNRWHRRRDSSSSPDPAASSFT